MKRILIGIVVALIIAVLPIGIAGCSKDDHVGNWKFTGEIEYVNISSEYSASKLDFNSANYTKENMPIFKLKNPSSGEFIVNTENSTLTTKLIWSGGRINIDDSEYLVPSSALTKDKNFYNYISVEYKTNEDVDQTVKNYFPYASKENTFYFLLDAGTYDNNGKETPYAIYAIYKK